MVKTGLERILTEKINLIQGKRVGVLCHPASINRDYQHIVHLFHQAKHINLTTIFSPQHGFLGEKQDNMIESSHIEEPITKVPIYSLYSETRTPTIEMLKNIDTLVIDLQDVGTRVYTFIYTMANCMKACREQNIEVIVLDRPNPINGFNVEGNLLNPSFQSFVGLYPIPIRHGMTIGELAHLFNHEYHIGCQLSVVEMNNYQREMWFDETLLPWVYPSPNMPTLDTATLYPGMVLFEGTIVSEGRGTTKPFELIGAPYINPYKLKEELDTFKLPGLLFRPIYFEPTFHKHSGNPCGGVQIHVTHRKSFKPYLTGITLLGVIKSLYPNNFEWKQPPYEYEYIKLPIDLLIGNQEIRKKLDSKKELYYIESSWENELKEFLAVRKNYLIY